MTLSMLDKMIDEKLRLIEALEHAREFISNGVAFGYIRLPEEGDTANDTLGIINEALRETRCEGEE